MTTATRRRKSTAAVVAGRVDEVLARRIDGASLAEIRAYAGENRWGVSDSQLRKYVAKADRVLRPRRGKTRKTVLALHLARRQSIFARALAAGELRTALASLVDEAKLLGLYPNVRALRRQLAELSARLTALEAASPAME